MYYMCMYFSDVMEKQLFSDSIYHLWRDCSLQHAMTSEERHEAVAAEVSRKQQVIKYMTQWRQEILPFGLACIH